MELSLRGRFGEICGLAVLNGSLYAADFTNKCIVAFDPGTLEHTAVIDIPGEPSALASVNGKLLVSDDKGCKVHIFGLKSSPSGLGLEGRIHDGRSALGPSCGGGVVLCVAG